MTDLTLTARLQASLLHTSLLSGAKQIGGVYHLDYHDALVSTDDRWKADPTTRRDAGLTPLAPRPRPGV